MIFDNIDRSDLLSRLIIQQITCNRTDYTIASSSNN
jgi:hypothetical protein